MDYKTLIEMLKHAPRNNLGLTSFQSLEWDAVDAINTLLIENQTLRNAANEVKNQAKTVETELKQFRDERLKVQYHGEELTVRELCDRLETAEKNLSAVGRNASYVNKFPHKGQTVWYIDDKGKPEKGTVFSVEIKNGILDSFSIDFEDDFDEFNGTAWGKYVFDNPDGKRMEE